MAGIMQVPTADAWSSFTSLPTTVPSAVAASEGDQNGGRRTVSRSTATSRDPAAMTLPLCISVPPEGGQDAQQRSRTVPERHQLRLVRRVAAANELRPAVAVPLEDARHRAAKVEAQGGQVIEKVGESDVERHVPGLVDHAQPMRGLAGEG